MQKMGHETNVAGNFFILTLLGCVWLIAILIGDLPAIALACLFAFVGIVLRPAIGVALSLVLWSTQLVQLLAGLPGIVFRSAPFVVLSFTLAVLLITRARPNQTGSGKLFWLIPLTFFPSAFASIYAEDFFGLILASSTYLVPFLALLIGGRLTHVEHRFVAISAAALLGANFIAAFWQFVSGVDQFLSLGLQYGTSVRTIDGIVRAPGLMIINSELGLFAGTLGLLALMDLMLGTRRNGITLNSLILVFSVGSLLFSTSRSGALVLACGALGAYLVASKKRQTSKKQLVGGFFFIVLLLAGFIAIGATSNTSWSDRITQWANLLQGSIQIFGSGLGAVGAASFSDYSNRLPSFTDNMYISILIQFGMFGILALAYALFFIYRKREIVEQSPLAVLTEEAKILIGAFAITAILVEVLDYQLAMMCAALIISRASLESRAIRSVQYVKA